MAFNPYDVLGVTRRANEAQIKAAYRQRARATHPDLAGAADAGRFQDVVKAWGILSNPTARALYDQTGVIDDNDPAAERKEAQALVVDLFSMMLGEATARGESLDRLDFVAGMKVMLRRRLTQEIGEAGNATRMLEERLRLRRRLLRKREGANVFADVLSRDIAALQAALESGLRLRRVIGLAAAELDSYESTVDLVAAFDLHEFGYSPRAQDEADGIVRWTAS